MPFWNYHTLAPSTLGWEINENESLKDYGANCRFELYGNHLEKLECAKVCWSLVVLLTFDYFCPPLHLCLPPFTFAFNWLRNTTDIATYQGEKLMVEHIIISSINGVLSHNHINWLSQIVSDFLDIIPWEEPLLSIILPGQPSILICQVDIALDIV